MRALGSLGTTTDGIVPPFAPQQGPVALIQHFAESASPVGSASPYLQANLKLIQLAFCHKPIKGRHAPTHQDHTKACAVLP